MHIIINNMEAVLKKGVSFDYISENRFFTGADSYTLSITFPLKGCKENLEIFGHINRKDCDLNTLLLECDIYDRLFHVHGAINIVEISETEVKTQFLNGRSVRNYVSDLDDVYINELTIGDATELGHFECSFHWGNPNSEHYTGMVALPWVNNTSGNLQNRLRHSTTGWFYYESSIEEDAVLSCQYYLLYVLKKVLDQCGYTYDLKPLESSPYRFLVIFNTFPCTWQIKEWALALPHWTVTEFLEQIELLTNGIFTIDSKANKISFAFNIDILKNQKYVDLQDVVDEHQVEIKEDSENNDTYLEQVNLKYSEASHQMQKFYSCSWAKKTMGVRYFNTFSDLKKYAQSYFKCVGAFPNVSAYTCLLYARDYDTHFVMNCYELTYNSSTKKYTHFMRLLPVDVFGPRECNTKENAQYTELGIVPVCIDHCSNEIGDCVFLECGTYGDTEKEDENQSLVVNVIKDGEPQQKEEFYDKIYVAYWDGNQDVQNASNTNKYPLPWIDNLWVDMFGNLTHTHMQEDDNLTLRLKSKLTNDYFKTKHIIDQSKKFTFKFLAKDGKLPDVQSVFIIHGKRYLAEKLTATFTENGMSQLVKMTAYRIING